ncbi:GNAT family N-acetyltransferase [Actinophytocola glycyrrhizae]|uniref:GNAT family N-acetyltransferase n=1 Tax=Actinophytocola glycyrrhizae TaxID=2044873 RepID=A0ABV9S438_9PSEU
MGQLSPGEVTDGHRMRRCARSVTGCRPSGQEMVGAQWVRRFRISDMYDVRTANPADREAVIALVTRLQQEPAHRIAFHGETPQEVAEELAAIEPEWPAAAVVAEDRNGRLRGVLSVEVDTGQRRAYLYGPFVDVPANHPAAGNLWQATADAMFHEARALPALAGVHVLELFAHRENRLLAGFADRHGIRPAITTRCFTLTAAPLRSLLVRHTPDDRVVPLPAEPAVRAAVAALHDRCFPGAPTTGAQLVAGERHTVVVLSGDNGLLGYAGGYTQAEEYYVDVVGVAEDARSCGVGRSLVRRLLGELAAADGVRDRAAALIRSGNDPSERMFTKLGFELTEELVSYRADSTTAHRPAV